MDIGKYNDYILAFEGDNDIVFNYPAKNFSQFFYINAKGGCQYISYFTYKNDREPELVRK